jgi:SAM-dependent methyltransferase
MYSEQELAAFYGMISTEYFAYQDHSRHDRRKELLKRVLGYYTGTTDPEFDSPGTVLDLGCGTGWFLERMRARGWRAFGVELNGEAARFGRESHSLEIFNGTLQQAKFPAGFFDYVRSNHSFEHLNCPDSTLDEIRRILKPKGKLFIGVPNIGGLYFKVFRQYWWHLTAPLHTFGYSKRTLSQLLAKHGFRVGKVSYNSDYFGLIGSLQIFLNRNTGRTSMRGRLVNSHLGRLACQWITNGVDFANLGDGLEVTSVKTGV